MKLISTNTQHLTAAIVMLGVVTIPQISQAQETTAPNANNILSQIELALSGSAAPAAVPAPEDVVQPIIDTNTVATVEPLVIAEPAPQTTADLLVKLGVPVFGDATADVDNTLINQDENTAPVIVAATTQISTVAHDDDEPHVGELLPDPVTFSSACAQDLALLSQRVQVYFGPGSTTLSAGARDNALLVARLAADCPNVRINVLGFTDPVGDEEVNIRISQARADSVVEMIATYGFDTSKFTAVSHTKDHGPECKHFDIVDRRVAFQIIEDFS